MEVRWGMVYDEKGMTKWDRGGGVKSVKERKEKKSAVATPEDYSGKEVWEKAAQMTDFGMPWLGARWVDLSGHDWS